MELIKSDGKRTQFVIWRVKVFQSPVPKPPPAPCPCQLNKSQMQTLAVKESGKPKMRAEGLRGEQGGAGW